jgi:hypothetical protein
LLQAKDEGIKRRRENSLELLLSLKAKRYKAKNLKTFGITVDVFISHHFSHDNMPMY